MLSFIPIKKGPLFIVIRRGAIVSFSLIIVPCSGIFYTLPFTIISCMLSLLQVSVVIINSKLYVLFIVLKQSGNLNPCYSFQNSLVSEFFLDSFDFKVSQFLCVYTSSTYQGVTRMRCRTDSLSLSCNSSRNARNSFGRLPQGYCEQKTP